MSARRTVTCLLGSGFLLSCQFLLFNTGNASAITCGYSVRNEEVSSDFGIELPWVGTIDPLGGEVPFSRKDTAFR